MKGPTQTNLFEKNPNIILLNIYFPFRVVILSKLDIT